MSKTKNNEEGVKKEDLSLSELRELVVTIGVSTKEDAVSLKKKELLEMIGVWEEAKIKEIEEKEATKQQEVAQFKMYKGKKIVSSTEIEVNGKVYEDILVESGETFRELKK